MPRPMFQGKIAFEVDQSFTLQVDGEAVRNIEIEAGEHYPADVLASMQAQAQAFAELADFEAELIEGRARLTLPDDCTLTWDETEIPEALRLDSAPMTQTTTGDSQCRGVFRSSLPLRDDRMVSKMRSSTAYSATTADVHTYGELRRRVITIRALGNERSGAADELRALRLFWADYFGAQVRYYPDELVADAFDEDDAPFGYHTIKIVGPEDFDPARPQPNFWGRWELTIEGIET